MTISANAAGDFPQRLLPVVLLVAVWWVLVWALDVPSRLMPSPAEVGRRIYDGLVVTGDLWPHLWSTFEATLLGFMLGGGLAVAVGSLLAMSRTLELLTYPLVVLIQAVPKVSVAPLILLWAGFDIRSTVILVALICFFPIFVGTFAGVRAAPPVLVDLFSTLNAGRFATFVHCNLPHAAGSIFAGMEVGWGFALVGCVVMEFITGVSGAGFLIQNSANNLDAQTSVASMVLLGVLGFAGGSLLQQAKRRLVFWEGSARHG